MKELKMKQLAKLKEALARGGTITYREALYPAMEITDQAEADAYLKELIGYYERSHDHDKALEIAKVNLGYFAGYYDSDTRARVEKLFSCSHPVFGSVAKNGTPSPEEAFEAGARAARQQLKEWDMYPCTRCKHSGKIGPVAPHPLEPGPRG